jgi:hypothetical protein
MTTTPPTQNPEVGKHPASPSQAYPMPSSASLANVKGLPPATPLTTPDQRSVDFSALNTTIAKHLVTVGKNSKMVFFFYICDDVYQLLAHKHRHI